MAQKQIKSIVDGLRSVAERDYSKEKAAAAKLAARARPAANALSLAAVRAVSAAPAAIEAAGKKIRAKVPAAVRLQDVIVVYAAYALVLDIAGVLQPGGSVGVLMVRTAPLALYAAGKLAAKILPRLEAAASPVSVKKEPAEKDSP